jgi:hypothetical protein
LHAAPPAGPLLAGVKEVQYTLVALAYPRAIDAGNHLRDALKYILLSHPLPLPVPTNLERECIIRETFENGTYPSLGVRMAQFDEKHRKNWEPTSYRSSPLMTDWPSE